MAWKESGCLGWAEGNIDSTKEKPDYLVESSPRSWAMVLDLEGALVANI